MQEQQHLNPYQTHKGIQKHPKCSTKRMIEFNINCGQSNFLLEHFKQNTHRDFRKYLKNILFSYMSLECHDGEFELDGELLGTTFDFECLITKVFTNKYDSKHKLYNIWAEQKKYGKPIYYGNPKIRKTEILILRLGSPKISKP